MVSGNFIPIRGEAPGKAGYLVAVGRHLDFISSAWNEQLQETTLRLHTSGGSVIEVAGREHIEDLLEELGLEGVPWEMNLENLESRDA